MKPRLLFISTVVLLLAVIVPSIYRSHVSAGILRTFPSVCLGEWIEPVNAQNEPQVDSNSRKADFTNANSTFPSKSGSKLFCSGFSSDALKDIHPQRIQMTVSWSIDDASSASDAPVPETSFIQNIIPQAYAQTQTEETVETVIENDEAVSTTTSADTNIDITDTATTSIEIPAEVQVEGQTGSVIDAINSLGNIFDRPLPEDTGDRIRVSYTLDGATWIPLGEVGSHNYKDRIFEVPMDGISIGTDISKLQVSFEYIGSKPGSVRIDGMVLEVSYKELSDLDKKVVFQEIVKEMPSFESQTLLGIRSVWPFVAVKTASDTGSVSLWLFDMREKEKGGYIFAEGDAVNKGSFLALKGDHLFWTVGTSSLYAFDLAQQSFAVSSNREVTPEGDQRFTFEGIPWTAIVRAENVYFYSVKTGEISSDDDSADQRKFADEYLASRIGYREDLVDLHLVDPRPEPDAN